MATWAIGDVQGCYASLRDLLDAIDFDRSDDRLWLVGDLVNRGPRSLEVLRWAMAHEDRITTVLGNHDLHLLALWRGLASPKKGDTLDRVLAARDADALLGWLRRRPVLHRDGHDLLVHAGLHPWWTAKAAETEARAVEAALRGDDLDLLITSSYAERKATWSESATGMPRLVGALSALTRLRVCSPDGTMHLRFKGPASEIEPGRYPWFDVPGRRSRRVRVVFGHWAALGLRVGDDHVGLDTGCVWGRSLTALRLDDLRIVRVPTAAEDRPETRSDG
jgi:bis(5'-nucleosyl)-tetraphosphatase (symmetrical)